MDPGYAEDQHHQRRHSAEEVDSLKSDVNFTPPQNVSYLAKSSIGDVFRRTVDDHLDFIQPFIELVVLVQKLSERPGRVHAGHIVGIPGQVTTCLLRGEVKSGQVRLS